MSEAGSAIIITRDPSLERLSERLVAEGLIARTIGGNPDVLRQAMDSDGVVAVLDCELPQEESFEIYRQLHGTRSVPTLMLVPNGGSWQSMEDPYGSLLDDYASKSASVEEVVLRLKAMMLRAGYRLPAPPPVPAPAMVRATQEADQPDMGKIVAVFSVKGGVGKTTIAVNLAVGLVKLFRARTLVVDADLWFGDVGILLNVVNGNSIWDLCEKDEPDIVALRKAVAQHESGVSVLLRPWDVTSVEKMDLTRVPRILQMYRTLFDYIIVDMQPAVDELNLQILDAADRILLATTPEIGAIANSSRFMQIAESLGYTNKTSLIVNRSNFGIGIERIQERLRTEVAGQVVSAGHKVVDAATKGTSLFVLDPDQKDQVTRDMTHIVELVAGRPCPEVSKPKKWLGSMLTKRSGSESKVRSNGWVGSPAEAGS